MTLRGAGKNFPAHPMATTGRFATSRAARVLRVPRSRHGPRFLQTNSGLISLHSGAHFGHSSRKARSANSYGLYPLLAIFCPTASTARYQQALPAAHTDPSGRSASSPCSPEEFAMAGVAETCRQAHTPPYLCCGLVPRSLSRDSTMASRGMRRPDRGRAHGPVAPEIGPRPELLLTKTAGHLRLSNMSIARCPGARRHDRTPNRKPRSFLCGQSAQHPDIGLEMMLEHGRLPFINNRASCWPIRFSRTGGELSRRHLYRYAQRAGGVRA